jgi:predicted transcriptional regulator
MWKKIKDNFDSGMGKVRWFSSLLNERLKIEFSLINLLHQSSEMEKKRAELMKTIGERVYDLRNGPARLVLGDPVITEAFHKLETLDAEIEDLRKRASEISRIET